MLCAKASSSSSHYKVGGMIRELTSRRILAHWREQIHQFRNLRRHGEEGGVQVHGGEGDEEGGGDEEEAWWWVCCRLLIIRWNENYERDACFSFLENLSLSLFSLPPKPFLASLCMGIDRQSVG